MFRKINTKRLTLAFVIMLVLVVIIVLVDTKSSRSTFNSELVSVDTADISKIIISPAKTGEEVTLVKNEKWQLNKEGKLFDVDKYKVNSVLDALTKMKSTGVIANQKEKWAEYDVVDSVATRVQIYRKKKKDTDLLIGRFNYTPSNNPYDRMGNFKTYVRVNGKKEVHIVKEFLSMIFTGGFNDYRDNTVLKINPEDINKVEFNYPADSSFMLTKENGIWFAGNEMADSALVAGYLNKLRNVTSKDFAEKNNAAFMPLYVLKIEGNNMIQPVVVEAESDTSGTIVRSSMNTDAYFTGSGVGLFSRMFISKKSLVKEN